MFKGTPDPTMNEELKTGAELQVTLCNWLRIALSTTSEARFRIEITCERKRYKLRSKAVRQRHEVEFACSGHSSVVDLCPT